MHPSLRHWRWISTKVFELLFNISFNLIQKNLIIQAPHYSILIVLVLDLLKVFVLALSVRLHDLICRLTTEFYLKFQWIVIFIGLEITITIIFQRQLKFVQSVLFLECFLGMSVHPGFPIRDFLEAPLLYLHDHIGYLKIFSLQKWNDIFFAEWFIQIEIINFTHVLLQFISKLLFFILVF